jgi:hypothetical protein
VKKLRKQFSNFVLSLKAELFLKRKHVLSLKKLVTLYNVFKIFHLTLVLAVRLSLPLLKQT